MTLASFEVAHGRPGARGRPGASDAVTGRVTDARPAGTEAWQALTVRSDHVDVVEVTGERAEVRATGRSVDLPDVGVVTSYHVVPDRPWIPAESVFENHSAGARSLWVGDALDHDGAGQRSGVPGQGRITAPYGSPAEYPPAEPWIGMGGRDPQTYGLIYDDAPDGLTAYGNGGSWPSTTAAATTRSRFSRRSPAPGSHMTAPAIGIDPDSSAGVGCS